MSEQRQVHRHPVADLLTDRQRARVAATTFVCTFDMVHPEGRPLECPLSVAAGLTRALGAVTHEQRQAVADFIDLADTGRIAPDDLKPMLGVQP